MNRHKFHSHDFDVDITLYRNEIAYDVDFASNRVARVATGEQETKKASLLTTESNESDFKVDYIDRLITHALTTVKQKLGFAVNPHKPQLRMERCRNIVSGEEVDNNLPSGDQSFSLSFSFEEGWQGTPQVLCDFIHSYVVNSVLTDWFQLTLPEQSAIFKAKADDDLKSLIHEGRSVVLVGVPGFYL